LIILLAVHVAIALLLVATGRRLGSRSFLVGALAPSATLVWAVAALIRGTSSAPITESWTWVSALDLQLTFRADGLSLVMLVVIGGIGLLVFGYSSGYFEGSPDSAKVAALLVAFAGAMTGVVLSDNILLLFVFWELTSVSSFLLIGTEDRRPAARAAAQEALLITGAGGVAMLAGLVVIGQQAGTWTLSGLLASPPSASTLVSVGVVLVLVGALTKSAQFPFHAWLPGAMSAPTPVSAYLHSATMVKAGIYLVARLSPALATSPPWRPLILVCGLASLIVGGYRALRQHDLKLLLAFGTISQLGLMLVLFGIGTDAAWTAGVVLLLAHAVFKAALFMSVGLVDHATGTRDLRRLDRLGSALPVAVGAAVVCAASMAGLPPLLGFVAKEQALGALAEPGSPGGAAVLLLVVVGSMLTVGYSARFAWGLLGPADPTLERQVAPIRHLPTAGLVVPGVVLAAVSIVVGLVPGLLDPLVEAATRWVGVTADADLALWHGVGAALAWSTLVILGGTALFVLRSRVERVQAAVPRLPGSQAAYDATVRGILRVADRVTGVTQSGSLPLYLGVIAIVTVASGLPLLAGSSVPSRLDWIDSPLQIVPAVVIVGAAIGAAVTGHRLTAVVLLGAVGYAVAALFMVQGAPDLAVAQLLIETLSVVVFVLVLRHLPDRFPERGRASGAGPSQVTRLAVAAAVGIFVFGFTLAATAERSRPSVADAYVDRSLPDGGGRNVVNVIVVDFRGLDTLGEITVLLTAALGVAALVRTSHRRDDERDLEAAVGSEGPVG
jgi:multicomponent Na+:H+ antiporter subunit A